MGRGRDTNQPGYRRLYHRLVNNSPFLVIYLKYCNSACRVVNGCGGQPGM